MKLATVVRAAGNLPVYAKWTIPIIKDFTKKWNSDFIELTNPVEDLVEQIDFQTGGQILYMILELYNLLDKYDRILHLDTDIIINSICPNPFEEVPYEKIGIVMEDKGSRLIHRREQIQKIQKQFGDIGWKEGYVNPSIMVVSKPHKNIFKRINGKCYMGWGLDCPHLGYLMNKLKMPIHELHWKWNSMRCFHEPWNGSPNRLNSYIIHYAGYKNETKIQMIKNDITTLYGNKYL